MNITNTSSSFTTIATYRYAKVSPTKVRRVINKLSSFSLDEALLILRFLPHKFCNLICNLLNSAYSNFPQQFDIPRTSVFIKEVRVDSASFLKRIQPHAQGKGFPIKKKMSHITILI